MHELSKPISDYKSLKKTISELEDKIKVIEDGIKSYMGELEEIKVDGITVRWKKILQNRFATTEFQNQHPALYEQFLTQKEIRRFTIT